MAPSASSLAVAPERRRRRWQLFLLAGLSGIVGIKVLAAQLLKLLLYHPSAYAAIDDYKTILTGYSEAQAKEGYRLDTVRYALGASAASQSAFLIRCSGARSSSSQRPEIWAVYGGNAMLAMDWFHFVWQMIGGLRRRSQTSEASWPSFLLVDYPGYGANAGEPSPASVQEASVAALRAALDSFPEEERPGTLNLLGHSLGSAAALQLAASGDLASLKPGRLVLSAPFTSIEAMAQRLLLPFLPHWLLRKIVIHHWENDVWVPKAVQAGWLVNVLHGVEDQLVPPAMGAALFRAAQEAGNRGKLRELPADHNNVLQFARDYFIAMGYEPPNPQGRM